MGVGTESALKEHRSKQKLDFNARKTSQGESSRGELVCFVGN